MKKQSRNTFKSHLMVLITAIALIGCTNQSLLQQTHPNSTKNTKHDRIAQSGNHVPEDTQVMDIISGSIARIVLGAVLVIFLIFAVVQFFMNKKLGKMILSTLVYFYQLTQLYGVFLFLPVVWNGNLLSSLLGFYSQGEYLRLDDPILVKIENLNPVNVEYWGKISIYLNPRYTNLVYPVTSIALMTVFFAQGVTFLLSMVMKKSPKIKSANRLANTLKWFLLETSMVKMTF